MTPELLRDRLRANLFDGDQSGVVTMKISTLLDEVVDILGGIEADECPCGHDDSEHVHYCSHETETGSCSCDAEYAREPKP